MGNRHTKAAKRAAIVLVIAALPVIYLASVHEKYKENVTLDGNDPLAGFLWMSAEGDVLTADTLGKKLSFITAIPAETDLKKLEASLSKAKTSISQHLGERDHSSLYRLVALSLEPTPIQKPWTNYTTESFAELTDTLSSYPELFVLDRHGRVRARYDVSNIPDEPFARVISLLSVDLQIKDYLNKHTAMKNNKGKVGYPPTEDSK